MLFVNEIYKGNISFRSREDCKFNLIVGGKFCENGLSVFSYDILLNKYVKHNRGFLKDEEQHPKVLGSILIELAKILGVAMSEYGHLSLDKRFTIARLREAGRSR